MYGTPGGATRECRLGKDRGASSCDRPAAHCRADAIREVTRKEARAAENAGLVVEATAAGCPLILALDSMAMAEHAFGLGLSTDKALRAVSYDYEADVTQEAGLSNPA